MKKYKIIPTKEQKRIMKCYWEKMQRITNIYYGRLNDLEAELGREIGIKDIEFFFCDNECSGIGNAERTMKLIHRNELEE